MPINTENQHPASGPAPSRLSPDMTSNKRIKLSHPAPAMTSEEESMTASEPPSTDVQPAKPPKKQRPQNGPPPPAESGAAPTDPAELARLLEQEMACPVEPSPKYAREIEYAEKLVLAPMVRSGTLPVRLMALHYGAGLVWGPEIVDKAIIGAQRVVDPETGVIKYTKKDGNAIFTTHPVEKPFLIYQIGTSDPKLAAEAARTVQQDVAGFDLNCGCPKPFSVHSGMGAALLSTPDLLISILRSLIQSTSVPVSCKIRLLPEQPATLLLAARILRTGIRNLTVHCRTRDMRSTVSAIWDRLGDIVNLGKQRGINVTCNGDGEGWANWQTIRERTGVSSVMIARAAEANPSIFRPSGPVSTCEELVPKVFLPLVVALGHHYQNTKFLLYQFKPSVAPISALNKEERRKFSDGVAQAKTLEQALAVWNLDPEQARKTGRKFIRDLAVQLKERLTETGDPLSGASAPHTIWEDRAIAEHDHTVVDPAPVEEDQVVSQEMVDDEEAAMNA